jgi:transglutaminase-like putative cysteine protease
MGRIGFITGILFFLFTYVYSQKVSDFAGYKEKYSDKEIVFLNLKNEISIDIKKTDLVITENRYEEVYYNSYKAGAFAENDIKSSEISKLKDISASTLLPDKDKFNEIFVKKFETKEVLSDRAFYEDLYSTSFIFPSLREGAITKTSSSFNITEPRFLPYVFVQRYYPVENFEFSINADKNIDIEIKYFFTDSAGIEFTKTPKNDRIIYTWKAKNLKSYKTEPGSPNYNCFIPQIIPYIKSYKVKDKEYPLLRNTDDLFKWYTSYLKKIDHKRSEEMKSTVDKLTKDCSGEMEKVKSIYKWVQENIKYVANEYGLGGFIPRDPQVIFDKRYGDCKDMASILVDLMDIAGVKVHYTWIGTRDLPYSYEEIPTSNVDNHMIATYIKNGTYYYLDATNPFLDINMPNSFIQGKEALIYINDSVYEVKVVPTIDATVNCVYDTVNFTIEDHKIHGKGILNLNGFYCSDGKYRLEKVKDKEDKSKILYGYLEKGNNKFNLDDFTINMKDTTVKIDYNFTVENYVNQLGDEIYLNMNLSQPYRDEELLKDNREHDFEFEFASSYVCNFSVNVPEGYEISYLPKNTTYKSDDFYYTIKYAVNGNKIIYNLNIDINTLLLTKDQFVPWNKLLKSLRTDYKEAIVLKLKK